MLSDSIRARAFIVVSLPTRKKKVHVSGGCQRSRVSTCEPPIRLWTLCRARLRIIHSPFSQFRRFNMVDFSYWTPYLGTVCHYLETPVHTILARSVVVSSSRGAAAPSRNTTPPSRDGMAPSRERPDASQDGSKALETPATKTRKALPRRNLVSRDEHLPGWVRDHLRRYPPESPLEMKKTLRHFVLRCSNTPPERGSTEIRRAHLFFSRY